MGMSSDSGEYMPSYFFVIIDNNNELNAEELLNSSTFFHEYIHFLQDIFLPYCARMNLVETRYLRLIEDEYRNRGLVIPFIFWDGDANITMSQSKSTWGDVKFIDNNEEIKEIRSEFFVIPSGQKVFKYTAELENGEEYQIGARDFLEYIAHKLEHKFYEGTGAPKYPYRTVDAVFNYYGLYSIPVECKIAIAEFVLHNDNPMNLFIGMVKHINKESRLDALFSYEELLKLLNLRWNSAGGFSETTVSKAARRLSDLRDMFKERFSGNDNSDIRYWLEKVIDYVSKFIGRRFQFSELYMEEKNDALEKIRRHIEAIGIPLVFNKRMDFISAIPNIAKSDQFLNLYFSFIFMKFALNGKGSCPAYRFCFSNNEDILDERCKDAPLIRWKVDFECPMGALFKRNDFNKI